MISELFKLLMQGFFTSKAHLLIPCVGPFLLLGAPCLQNGSKESFFFFASKMFFHTKKDLLHILNCIGSKCMILLLPGLMDLLHNIRQLYSYYMSCLNLIEDCTSHFLHARQKCDWAINKMSDCPACPRNLWWPSTALVMFLECEGTNT